MCCENCMEKSVDSFITGVVLKFTRNVFSWIWVLILTFWFSDIVCTSPVESLLFTSTELKVAGAHARARTHARHKKLHCLVATHVKWSTLVCAFCILFHGTGSTYVSLLWPSFATGLKPLRWNTKEVRPRFYRCMQVFAWHKKWYIIILYKFIQQIDKTKHWQPDSPENGKIWEILSADSRRNSELPQLGCVHFPRWQEETSRFERPRSSGSTHDENSVVLRYLLHSFANVLQCFLDLLLLVSWFWFWEKCLSWWSLYFPHLRIKPFPSAV